MIPCRIRRSAKARNGKRSTPVDATAHVTGFATVRDGKRIASVQVRVYVPHLDRWMVITFDETHALALARAVAGVVLAPARAATETALGRVATPDPTPTLPETPRKRGRPRKRPRALEQLERAPGPLNPPPPPPPPPPPEGWLDALDALAGAERKKPR